MSARPPRMPDDAGGSPFRTRGQSSRRYHQGVATSKHAARVDDHCGVAAHKLVVDATVGRHQQHGIVGFQHRPCERNAGEACKCRKALHERRARHQGVMIGDLRTKSEERVEYGESRAFADVVDISLVGYSEQEDAGATQRLAASAQGAPELLDDVPGHLQVDLASKLDEPRGEPVRACFRGQIERVDRNAMSPPAGPWIKAHETERLGRRGIEDLPDVDVQTLVDHLQLVDECDVDAPEDVLEQLGGLSGARTGDWDNSGSHELVECEYELRRD